MYFEQEYTELNTNPSGAKTEDEKRREQEVLEEQRKQQERAIKESLPGFNRSWYEKTPEEIAEEINRKEGN